MHKDYPYLHWLTTFSANLSPISMISILKYWVILNMVKSSASMPWRFMKQIMKKGPRHYARPFNQQNSVYQVCTTHNPHRSNRGDPSHEVRLLENTCTCDKWEIHKISCSHVIAICIREHVNAMMYIDSCYTLQ